MSSSRDPRPLPPLPDQREALGFEAIYTADEFERLQRGFQPMAMEDRWWILFEDGWLYFRNATSRACIFWLRLEPTPSGARVAESWVNRDPKQFRMPRLEDNQRMLKDIIQHRLLAPERKTPGGGATDTRDGIDGPSDATGLQPVLLKVRRDSSHSAGELVPSLCMRVGSKAICIAFRSPPIIVHRPLRASADGGAPLPFPELPSVPGVDSRQQWIEVLLATENPLSSPAARELLECFRRLSKGLAPFPDGALDVSRLPSEEPGA